MSSPLSPQQLISLLDVSITTLHSDGLQKKSKSELINIILKAIEEVHGLTQEKSGLTQEVHILTQALAVSGNDLGLEQDSDLRSVLLYDLALSQQARAALAIDLARRTDKMKSLQKTVSTLSFVREANNLELIKCERKIKELEQQAINQQNQVSMATKNQEKLNSLVAAYHDLSSQFTACQLRAATAERERDHLQATIPRITVISQEAESQRLQLLTQHQQQLDTLRAQHTQQLDAIRDQHKLQMDGALEQHTGRERYVQSELEKNQQQLATLRDQHLQHEQEERVLRGKCEQQAREQMGQLTKQHEHELGRLRAQLEQAHVEADKDRARNHSDNEAEKGKLQEKIAATTKEMEKLKVEITQLKNREGESQEKLALLKAEHVRQGKINSFQEVIGTQMANIRAQLNEAKEMYSRVSAENALLATENARLLVLLDEEIKSKSTHARSPSPHVTGRPSSSPSLMRASSFVDTFTPSSLKIPPGSSTLTLPSRPATAPNSLNSTSPTSPDIQRKHKRRTKYTSSSSRSSTPEPVDVGSAAYDAPARTTPLKSSAPSPSSDRNSPQQSTPTMRPSPNVTSPNVTSTAHAPTRPLGNSTNIQFTSTNPPLSFPSPPMFVVSSPS